MKKFLSRLQPAKEGIKKTMLHLKDDILPFELECNDVMLLFQLS